MKIGIVNDSIMATEVLRRIISSSPHHQILWHAANGAEAVSLCQETLPDLLLMDLMMPVMDGVMATRLIMKNTPCAILIVTSSVTGNASMVFEAMGVGALDVVATPVLGKDGSPAAINELLRKIELIGKLIGHPAKRNTPRSVNGERRPPLRRNDPTLIAIGASTGGPQALTAVLSPLPIDLNAAVVIVQHMDKKFTQGLATWLDQQVALPVKVLCEGERPSPRVVQIPCTDNHLIMNSNGTLGYSVEPTDNFYHPSVDVFFQSLIKGWHGKIIAVLLTGMGRDGASGLLALREEGHHTIAQDEATSVVYGMPKAAMQISAAIEVLPLHEIGARIQSLVVRG